MKTRLLLIIGIVIIAAIIVSAVGTTQYQTAYNQNCNSDGGKVVGFLKCIYINEDFGEKLGSDCRMMFGKGTPEMFDCLEKIEEDTNVPPPINLSAERDSAWVIDAEDELYSLGCDKPILEYLYRSSNLLDDDFDGNYFQKFIGLPDGVSKEKFEECVEFILEKRMPKDDVKSTQEHYEIKITGLKDVYLVGERYDFSYILSGYGHPCGSKTVTFPDSNGDTIGSASSASCIANLPMGIFVFDIQKEQGITYGHVGIKNPGTYTVTVTFDKPSKYFPTTVSKEFRVTEK